MALRFRQGLNAQRLNASTPFASANLRPPIRELSAVASISSRWSKFAQLVADHVLGHEYRYMLSPVVNRKCVADHVRDDRGASTPRLDELLLVLPVQIGDLL